MRYQTAVLNDPYGWVSVSPAGGISTGDVQSASVTYSTAGLAAGVYTAQIRLSGTDDATGAPATNGDLTVNLELTVHGSPVLKTQAQSWRQTTLENHARQSSFLIWNDGQAPRGSRGASDTTDA
mgnify:FL=1